MKKIFWGIFFILLDFNITIDSSVVGLFPDFIGWLLLFIGITSVLSEYPYFSTIKPFSIGMAIYSGILYFLDIIGYLPKYEFLTIILGIVSTVIFFWVLYQLIMGFEQKEKERDITLNADVMHTLWLVLLILSISMCICILLPVLFIICGIAYIVIAIIFLVKLWNEIT